VQNLENGGRSHAAAIEKTPFNQEIFANLHCQTGVVPPVARSR
jgi:hypothetical protein